MVRDRDVEEDIDVEEDMKEDVYEDVNTGRCILIFDELAIFCGIVFAGEVDQVDDFAGVVQDMSRWVVINEL